MTTHHKIIMAAAFSMFLVCGNHQVEAQAAETPLIGIADFFPEVPMPVPVQPDDRAYLGLAEGETFTLSHVIAALVLVEILNVHCSGCQMQAPVYNKLFDLIESDAGTRGKIKMLGIAVGNGEKEVKAFREAYNIRFTVVPDPRWVVHRAIGGSRTPYSIFVRQDDSAGPGVVAGTHLGFDPDYLSVHYALSVHMNVSVAKIRGPDRKEERKTVVVVEPIMTEEELATKARALLAGPDDKVRDFQRIDIDGSRRVYTGLVDRQGSVQRFFAEAVSRPSVCDVCHDVHFIYVFDTSGKVRKLEPLQLTKWENKPWDEADIAKMRERILGRYISMPLIFNPEVDAVSSATMTSAIIFNSISQGEALLNRLKEMGYM